MKGVVMTDIEACLAWIRRPTSDFKEVERRLRVLLQRKNLSLEAVGSSEEELNTCRVKSLLLTARNHFNVLSIGASMPDAEIICMRGLLKLADLDLDAIPTTEEELVRLAVRLPKLPTLDDLCSI